MIGLSESNTVRTLETHYEAVFQSHIKDSLWTKSDDVIICIAALILRSVASCYIESMLYLKEEQSLQSLRLKVSHGY